MHHKNKHVVLITSWLLAAWSRWLLGLSLLLVAAACSSNPATIGVGLPSLDASTGAYLVDTLTVRASTVLRDSVITSGSDYLFVGRYRDRWLGAITAKSYVTLGLGGSFVPDPSFVPDSAVLVLTLSNRAGTTDNTSRYGDTTKTQTLVQVRRLNGFIATTQFGFASPKLSPVGNYLDPTVAPLNDPAFSLVRRARPNLSTLRLRLRNDFRDELMNNAKSGQLTTQEQLDQRYPGFALLPDAADDAALVRFTVASTATNAALMLYYHDPTDPSTVQSHAFSLNGGRHFYQTEADRTGTDLQPLTTSLQQLDASKTSQQTYIEGALGLQTKLEIPYLFDLRNFGQHIVLTSATMTATVPVNTDGTNLNLAPPASISVSTTDINNHPGTTFVSSTPYSAAITNVDGNAQAGYTWSVLTYCQNVLNNVVPNGGMLLNTTSPALPERVVLGGPNRGTNKLQLRIYLISND